jgi:hypothetical protein
MPRWRLFRRSAATAVAFVEPKRTVELVPWSHWGASLAQLAPRDLWDTLRRACYRRAGYRCEACGGTGPEHPVEAHEIWSYDEERRVQKLVRLIAFCPDYHAAKHFGRTIAVSKLDPAFGDRMLAHLQSVIGWNDATREAYLQEAFSTHRRRDALGE